ncbi:hypothetical protein E3N88_14466 [Mikania micrantha]|uniref:Glycosyltransferase N-terminal domain-containing protein n=1 Tax=Mikania micrantha TaxID=192012 RepID=A0A5N6P443_9ASTR|nr:hypothetical protein E3N88_14466 [Mikania micrantha]
MGSPSPGLHFILFPLMAPGHMIPMVDMAKILAQRDNTVTIFTTTVNANRFKPVIDRANHQNGFKIHVLELQLPLTEVGLPEGCENFDLLPSAALAVNLFAALMLLEQPAETMVRGLSLAPSCIISDNMFPWTTDVAQRLNIPRLVFYGPGCFPFVCTHVVASCSILDQIESDSEYFVLPGLPDQIEVTKPQASCWGRGKTKERIERFERAKEAQKGAFGIVVNSFMELEPKYVERFAMAEDKRVWCVGPVSLCNKSFEDIAERGNKAAKSELDCLKWLDSKEPRIGAEVPVPFGENDKFEVKVKREHIKRALKCSMDDGEEGMARRKQAKQLGEMAKKAMEKGGSSHFNMTSMIEAVVEELAKNSKS